MITPLYVALNGLVLIGLAICVVVFRVKHKVTIGDGGIASGMQSMRAQANFIEYVPLALLLMAGYEYMSQDIMAVHICGIVLTVGRIFHGYGLNKSGGPTIGRAVGTLATWAVLIYLIVRVLWISLGTL